MKIKISAAALVLAFSLIGFCAVSKFDFPSPKGFINDFAGILSAGEKQQLISIADQLKQKNGSELAVAVVDSVSPLDPKAYAVGLFAKWGVGQKGKNNGVLILLAMQERRIEIEVGYGLEGVLTDAACGRILDAYAIPSFKQGKFGEGLVATARAASRLAAGEKFDQVMPKFWNDQRIGTLWLLFLASLFFIWLMFRSIKKKIPLLPMGCGIAVGALWGFMITLFFDAGIERFIITFMGGYFGLFVGLFTELIMTGGGGGGGGSSGSSYHSSSDSSSSSSSSSNSSSSSSSSSFGGGSSGGGGAGRSW